MIYIYFTCSCLVTFVLLKYFFLSYYSAIHYLEF